MSRNPFLTALATLAFISNASLSHAGQQYSFTTIDVPPEFNYPSSNNKSFALGINNRNQIAGYYRACCVSSTGGFFLSNGVYNKITPPIGNDPIVSGINDLDHIVGYSITSNYHETGFLYDGSTFTSIDYPGAADTSAWGINDAGEVVGWYDIGT